MKLKKIIPCVLLALALFPMSREAIASDPPESGSYMSDAGYESSINATYLAINEGDLESVKYFIQNGVNIDDDVCGYTPLQLAAYLGHLDIVTWLVENGADINAVNENEDYLNPITYAAKRGLEQGDWDVVRYLACQPQIDINYCSHPCQDGAPSNALTFACCGKDNNLEIVKFLVQHGAKPYVASVWGEQVLLDNYNAIEMAAAHNQNEIFDYFLNEKRAEIGDLSAILYPALNHSNVYAVRRLLKLGARFDSDDDSAMLAAVEDGSLEMVKTLVEYHVPVNITNDRGETPLHLAAKAGNKDIIDVLISCARAMVFAMDNQLRTPLHYAAGSANSEAVESLLKHGANPNAMDVHENKPLDFAQSRYTALLEAHRNRVVPNFENHLNNCNRIIAILTPLTTSQGNYFWDAE